MNAKNLPYTSGRAWSHGLCGCCDQPGTCFKAWCCPCVTFAQNKRRLEYLDRQGIPDPEHGGEFVSGDCWLHTFLTCCFNAGWVLQIGTRNSIRSRYSIRGDPFADCCTVFWCNPCSLTQESRELELEETSLGWSRQK
ncbi:PLAC8-domain-containing protein [Pluteus cervinus]|uniref:PLAC8-domain-containing protein n=1 Tax=Pluteus cervinus TaxID=181527 RepID=A0ACD3B1Y1_9AGAR|nr:PLAC8-domain-containing protein [Pluteus cervinus]